jgi:hypothetical protein
MSEQLNWIQQLRKSFEGFEPNVTGDWNQMEQRIDAAEAGQHSDLTRRVKNAQRVAAGATAIAAGMAFWMIAPMITEEPIEVDAGSGLVEVEAIVPSALQGQDRIAVLVAPEDAALEGGARTSNTFVIDLPSLTVTGSSSTPNEPERMAESSIPSAASSDASAGNESATEIGSTVATKSNMPESESSATTIDAALAAMTASVQEACAGTEVSFALNGLDEEGSVLWNFGDGGFSQEVAPTHIYDNAGSYDITVSVRAPGDGIIRTRTVENMIVVRPKPAAKMDWEFFDASAAKARVRLINQTEDASSSTWLLQQEGLKEAETMLEIPGEYHVNLVASNKFGCQDVAVENIRLGSRKDAIAPALFSPDGDGRYDTFMPLMVMDFEGAWSMTVWDGERQVFETKDVRNPWKGQLDGGGRAQVGKTYTWKLETTTPAGDKHLFVDEVLIDGE